MFSGAISEKNLQRMGKIYRGKPLKTKNRRELLASLKPKDWQYLRADNGDMPIAHAPQVAEVTTAPASTSLETIPSRAASR